MTKKFITWFIAFAMVLSLLPSAFAFAEVSSEDMSSDAMSSGEAVFDSETDLTDPEQPVDIETQPVESGEAGTEPQEMEELIPEKTETVVDSQESSYPAAESEITAAPIEEELIAPEEAASPAATEADSYVDTPVRMLETEEEPEVNAMAAGTASQTAARKWATPIGKKTVSLSVCRNAKGIAVELKNQAGQKLYGYDTVQGAAAGKGYGYYALYNRKQLNAKIVKVRLKDMKVVKVSAVLGVCHANDLTYNGKRNIIVVANSDPKAKRLTIVSASTLKIKYHKTLKVTSKVKGMTKKQRKNFKGVGAIAYNEKHNCYICRIRKTNDLLFLDANFKPYKKIKQEKKVKGMVYQGMDSYKDCIMVCQSFKGQKRYNLITFYNMKGQYQGRFTMGKGQPALELESIFHNGRQFYAAFYSSYAVKTEKDKTTIVRNNFFSRINNL